MCAINKSIICVCGQVKLVIKTTCKVSNTLKYLRMFSTKLQLNPLTKELSLYCFFLGLLY